MANFQDLLPGGAKYVEFAAEQEGAVDVSLVTGRVRHMAVGAEQGRRLREFSRPSEGACGGRNLAFANF